MINDHFRCAFPFEISFLQIQPNLETNMFISLQIVTAAFIPILIMQIVRIKDNRSAQNVSNMTPQQTTESWRNRMRKLYYFYNSPVIKFVFSLVS